MLDVAGNDALSVLLQRRYSPSRRRPISGHKLLPPGYVELCGEKKKLFL